MKVSGMPGQFWVVTTPTRHSTLGDICFLCDFKCFALQIRGGLDEQEIIGIFSGESEAVTEAKRLLALISPETN